MFDACGDFNKHIMANLNTLLDASPGDCGSYTEISSVFTANVNQSSSLPGMLYAHFLHGHPHPASRTLSMSQPGMELLRRSKIISLTLITNTTIRLKITLDLASFTPTLS